MSPAPARAGEASRPASSPAALVRANVAEIAADPVLRAYGAALALVHVLTVAFWRGPAPLEAVLPRGATPICWPFFEACHRYRVLDRAGVEALLWAYLALAVLAAALLWRRAWVGWAWALLVVLELLRVLIVVQDYRLRMNQHYMASFVAIAFLALPAKRRLLRYLVVLFYPWAGLLKLNADWLTGQALPAEALWLPARLVPAACAYVVVLETVLVFGLLARRASLFWATLGQLVLFHAMSWPIVGFYYPALMLALLSIFPLARLAEGEAGRPRLAAFAGGREPLPTYALLAGFSLLQLVPHLFPGDAAVTGEGRVFALHMFDARVVCEAHVTLHDAQGRSRRVRIAVPGPGRTRCDPVVYLSVGRALCREGVASGRWVDLDLSLRSRRATEPALRPVVQVDRFCGQDLRYDLWRPNPWILR